MDTASNPTASSGLYSADKALVFPERIADLAAGRHIAPVHLHLILSDWCNLDCPQCAYRISGYPSSKLFVLRDEEGAIVDHNPKRQLQGDVALKVLDDFKALGGCAVEFTGGGEPTTHPDFEKILGHAQEIGLDTALVTNGLLLHKIPTQLVLGLSWLRVSIDAATPETYAKVRPNLAGGGAANLVRILAAIKDLRRLRDANIFQAGAAPCVVIGTGFVVQKENWHELYDACHLYHEAGADNVRISGAFTPTWEEYHAEHRDRAIALERRAVNDFSTSGFRVFGRFGQKLDDLAARPDYKDCHFERFVTYLGADGNLYRCCVTSYNEHGLLGNIHEAGGFAALWRSDKVRAALDGFDAQSCTRCQFNDRNRAIGAAVETLRHGGALRVLTGADVEHATFV